MSDLHTAAKTLERVLAEAKKSERHHTVAETRYWCDQYKQIANEAIRYFCQALANEALDKMAENARELGLDYAPVQADELYLRLHTLSKLLESSGRIDEMDHRDAYPTILEAMGFVMEAQRTWVGLTDEERVDLWKTTETDNRMVLIEAIEAKLKEKNA